MLVDHLVYSDQDSKLLKTMKTSMIDNLFTKTALVFLDVLAFVGPRFKLPSFLSKEEKV